MARKQITFRVEEELEKEVKEIGKEIERSNPGAEANFSTISRYAMEEYVRVYKSRCKMDSLFLEIPVDNLSLEQLEKIESALNTIVDTIKEKDIDQVTTEKENKFLTGSYQNITKVIRANKIKAKNDEELKGE